MPILGRNLAPHIAAGRARAAHLLAALAGLAGCVDGPSRSVSVQQLSAHPASAGGLGLSMNVLATDADQVAEACDPSALQVGVRMSQTGEDGAYSDVPGQDVSISCVASDAGDFALVLDNSGSEATHRGEVREAASAFVDKVTAAGGRASIVRVSTDAEVLHPLGDQVDELHAAIDSLHGRNGWTSLWDGARLGNETLGSAPPPAGASANGHDLCEASGRRGIVLFTDGRDNNSAGEKLVSDKYPGDGIDTTLTDLERLEVDGARTPIYTIGLGDRVDSDGLAALATASGGRFLAPQDQAGLDDAFAVVGGYGPASHQVCVDVPDGTCGELWLEISVSWAGDAGQVLTEVQHQHLHVSCPATPASRTATILLTMSNPGIPEPVARTLAAQTVAWVSPKPSPAVLVVLDDGNHGEFAGDAAYVRDELAAAGRPATLMDEPTGGLTPADVDGYDVVWFTNPGYPMDDRASFDTLLQFSQTGGGVVLQGDDMSWAAGDAFSLAPLTHLDNVDNGTSYCGERTDNDEGASYRVHLAGAHPVVGALDGVSFDYGDDIDGTLLRGEGEQVVATADLPDVADCHPKTAITVFDPAVARP